MSPWALWLCVILITGIGMGADVPFVFDETTSGVASYSSDQIGQAHISSPDLAGVPAVIQAADDEVIAFPVTAGSNSPIDTTEKKVADLKRIFDECVDTNNSYVLNKGAVIAAKYSGDLTIDQVSAIYEYLKNGDGIKRGWSYVRDRRGLDYYRYANESLKIGDDAGCSGGGDCDDFAILTSALVESIGGTTRIILARNNTTGGHAYAEVYLGQINASNSQAEDIISWLKQEYETDKIYTHIDTDTKDVWLNLDWGPDERGNAHPGGPFYPGDKHYIICIRDTYGKTPLKLPEKANKPPALISLAADKADPQDAGASITWTANAKDPDKDQILYRFFVNDEPETNWTSDNTWTWQTTDDDIGQKQIEARIRDGKHKGPNRFDDNRIFSFNITVSNREHTTSANQTEANEKQLSKPSQDEVAINDSSIPATSTNIIPSAGTSIVFPDPNLEAVIRKAINKSEGAIYASDLEGLTRLDASFRRIKDLTGLEHCTNLINLDMHNNQITDVSPLVGLNNLQDLNLNENRITDENLLPLARLNNLQELRIDANQITDVLPLAGLNNLQTLYLGNNPITDISPLAGLNNLQYLYLNYNHITDVSPLAGLNNLQYLWLDGNQITDISPLAGLNNLQELHLSNNQIMDVSPLARLSNLQALYLDRNHITDMSALSKLTDCLIYYY